MGTDLIQLTVKVMDFGCRHLHYGVVETISVSCGESRKPTSGNMEARGISAASVLGVYLRFRSSMLTPSCADLLQLI
jgi:hypothetical protein